MKPESESDGVYQGLDGIQTLGFRYAELLAPKGSMDKPRTGVPTSDDLQFLQFEEIEKDGFKRSPVLNACTWIVHLDGPTQFLGHGCH